MSEEERFTEKSWPSASGAVAYGSDGVVSLGLSKWTWAVKVRIMSTINTTIHIGDDSAGVIAGLLSRFAKGQRVRVALTDEPTTAVGSKPDLVDWLLACPEKGWFTPAERGETTDGLKPLLFE